MSAAETKANDNSLWNSSCRKEGRKEGWMADVEIIRQRFTKWSGTWLELNQFILALTR